jgi:glycosyltransferase involved in cell wall biosynthesis
MPIRVLHIIGNLKLGGAQVCVRYLVENADKKDVENFVYPLRWREIDMPIKGSVIRLPYRNYDPRKFFAILRLCRKYDIDILVGHLTKPIMGCLLSSFFHKCKVVVYEHGPVSRKGPQYSLYRFVLRFLWRRAAVFVAVSRNTAEYLVRRIGIAPDRIRVIPNAVEFNVFDPQKVSAKMSREKLGISDDDMVVGFVGRLNYVKGVDLLIKATALLLQRSRRYFLLIAGYGPQQKSLEELALQFGITDRVRFLSFCDNIPEVMAAFNVGVVPSRQESFGIVCLELMRMKIPVISSGVGGMAEYIADDETGLILKENTPGEICTYIERLAGNEHLQGRLVDAAYKFCERFSTDKYVKAVQQMYKEVLREGY